MLAILRFSLQDVFKNYRTWLAMAALVAVTAMIYLGLGGYRNALQREFGEIPSDDLVVQESNTFGEFYGSRLPAEIKFYLLSLGVTRVIPEIHDYTGTSITNITILRGIDLEHYKDVNSFSILAGRELHPADTPRNAMIGYQLQKRLTCSPGQMITLRGREFMVVGIFKTGTYVDNEAWISLEDAQSLLGYGKDVSIYIIPDEGILKAGDTIPEGISIVKRGLGPQINRERSQQFLAIMELVYGVLGFATIITLANILFRVAWIHRHELAVLRCVGFNTSHLIIYLFGQAFLLCWMGELVGTIITVVVFFFLGTNLMGMSIHPILNLQTIIAGLLQSSGIAIIGTVIPAWWFNRLNLAGQLRSE